MTSGLDISFNLVPQRFLELEADDAIVPRGELFEAPADVAKIIADPTCLERVMTVAAREGSRKAGAYARIIKADAAKTHARAHAANASRAKISAKPTRVNHSRAIHSHVAHGGARAASGDDGSGSASSDGGDGPPSRCVEAQNPDPAAREIRALVYYNAITRALRWRRRTLACVGARATDDGGRFMTAAGPSLSPRERVVVVAAILRVDTYRDQRCIRPRQGRQHGRAGVSEGAGRLHRQD